MVDSELDIEDEKKSNKKKNTKKVYKCPNCGASLKSFEADCPYCHSEIREIKTSSSMKDFSKGLEKKQGAREIASYIKNYPIPNSREDLTEFMILVTSNISMNEEDDDDEEGLIQKALLTKMEQIKKKAELSIKNKDDLNKILELYDNKKKELKFQKIKDVLIFISIISGFSVMGTIMYNPILALAILLLVVSAILFIFCKIKVEGKKEIDSNKYVIYIVCIVLLVLSLVLGIKGCFFNHDKNYYNYYNKKVEKYNVEVSVDFNGNLLFNKYDVELEVYDQKETLYHGVDKTINLKLPNGRHKLKFKSMESNISKIVELNVAGNTKVTYNISCGAEEIKVKELSIENNLDK